MPESLKPLIAIEINLNKLKKMKSIIIIGDYMPLIIQLWLYPRHWHEELHQLYSTHPQIMKEMFIISMKDAAQGLAEAKLPAGHTIRVDFALELCAL